MMQVDVAKHWYRPSLTWLTFLLLPFSWLFRVIVWVRRKLYRYGILSVHRFNVPVIVVGNLTVGGTGKTPFVIWLAHYLQLQGYKPGIVTRGVGGKKQTQPRLVNLSDQASEVGDETLLLRTKTHCPVMTCVNRAAAVKALLQKENCNIIISDDGLQHYRLARTIEIVLVDGQRGLGNKQLLPAGPLREPISRLQEATFVITNMHSLVNANTSTAPPLVNEATVPLSETTVPLSEATVILSEAKDLVPTRRSFASLRMTVASLRGTVASLRMTALGASLHGHDAVMQFTQQIPQSLVNDDTAELHTFVSRPIHAIAGIGNPEQFFQSLEQAGLTIIRHIFPDHYLYQAKDINFPDDLPIIMTEKDAVKCKGFANQRHWYLPIQAELSKEFQKDLLSLLSSQETSHAEKDFVHCASRQSCESNLSSTNE